MSSITSMLLISSSQSENQYETVHLQIQRDGGEETRVEGDATTTSAAQERDEPAPGVGDITTTTAPHKTSGEGPNTAPPPPPPRCKDTCTDPIYTEAVTVSSSKTAAPPPATDMVVYDDIQGFQNQDVHYTCSTWLIITTILVIAFYFRVSTMQ